MHPTTKKTAPIQFDLNGKCDHFSRPIAWQHTFYLGDVNEPEEYNEWFEIIRSADVDDQIMININSIGGVYSTALQLRRAMKECNATVCCNIEGLAHSAASLIFLSGDAFIVSEGSSMLIHDYSGAAIGKGSEMIRQIQHEKISIDKFFSEVYKHFLTPEEIKNVLAGQDLWLDSDEIVKRTKKMVAERIKEEDEDNDELSTVTEIVPGFTNLDEILPQEKPAELPLPSKKTVRRKEK